MHVFDLLDHVLATRGLSAVRRETHWDAVDADLTNLGELAVIRWSWFREHEQDLLRVLPGAERAHTLLPALDRQVALVDDGSCGVGEVFAVPHDASGWRPGAPFVLFEERMKTRFVANGMPTALAHALAGALHELASNAEEHAQSPVPPVAIYDVRPGRWSLSLSDVGVGMIGSLSTNPQFHDVQDDVSALRAALRDGVSATGQPGRGHGFGTVFRAFADRACTIRLRSVGAVANWKGNAPAAHLLALEAVSARVGFHIQLSGSL